MTIKVKTYHAGYGDAPASLHLSGPSGELLNLLTAICLADGDNDPVAGGPPAEDEAEEADELVICLPDLSAGPVDESGESAGFATVPEATYVIRDASDGTYVVSVVHGYNYTVYLSVASTFRSVKAAEAWVAEQERSYLLEEDRWNVVTAAQAEDLDKKAALA